MAQITLELPDHLLRQASLFGHEAGQDVSVVLAERLLRLWSFGEFLPQVLSESSLQQLTNDEVLELADLKMDGEQNRRLGELQRRGKMQALSQAEEIELFALLQVYQLGQLRKSEGLAEAVQRDLRIAVAAT